MEVLGILIFSLFAIIVAIAITVMVTRWIFRVDDIVDLLRTVAANTAPPVRQAICEACEKPCPSDQLHKLNSGQLVCPDCRRQIDPSILIDFD